MPKEIKSAKLRESIYRPVSSTTIRAKWDMELKEAMLRSLPPEDSDAVNRIFEGGETHATRAVWDNPNLKKEIHAWLDSFGVSRYYPENTKVPEESVPQPGIIRKGTAFQLSWSSIPDHVSFQLHATTDIDFRKEHEEVWGRLKADLDELMVDDEDLKEGFNYDLLLDSSVHQLAEHLVKEGLAVWHTPEVHHLSLSHGSLKPDSLERFYKGEGK